MTAEKRAEIQGRMLTVRNMLLAKSLAAASIVDLVQDVEFMLEEVREHSEALENAYVALTVLRSPVRIG